MGELPGALAQLRRCARVGPALAQEQNTEEQSQHRRCDEGELEALAGAPAPLRLLDRTEQEPRGGEVAGLEALQERAHRRRLSTARLVEDADDGQAIVGKGVAFLVVLGCERVSAEAAQSEVRQAHREGQGGLVRPARLLLEQHTLEVEAAVCDPAPVGLGEAGEDLACHLQGVALGQGAMALQPLCERLAGDRLPLAEEPAPLVASDGAQGRAVARRDLGQACAQLAESFQVPCVVQELHLARPVFLGSVASGKGRAEGAAAEELA